MPVGVCYHREPGWEQDQWSWVFSHFGIEDIWEYGGPAGQDIYQPVARIKTAEELPDIPLVVLAAKESRYIKGTHSLVDFKHPDKAIYLFGGSHLNLSSDVMGTRSADHLVYIPVKEHEMYAHAAACIVLYARFLQRGGSFG